MTTKHFQRPTDVYTGEVGLANKTKYRDDSNASPKITISSLKVDGDMNYVVDALNQLYDTAISGTLPDGSVTNPKFASGTIGGIKVYDATGHISDVVPPVTAGLPFVSNGVGNLPGYQPITSAGLDIASVTNDRIAANSVSADKIQDASITPAKLASQAASTLIGKDSAGAGAPIVITLGANLTMSASGVLAAAGATSGAASFNEQLFSSSGTWTKPANLLFAFVETIGGGGSGGSGSGGSPTGTSGGTTSFGTFVAASGGAAGNVFGGSGGIGTIGTDLSAGTPGDSGSGSATYSPGGGFTVVGGNGGSSAKGGGGLAAAINSSAGTLRSATNATGYGGGGAGSSTNTYPMGGGGGGGYASKMLLASTLSASTVAVTVGAGGAISGATSGTAGMVRIISYLSV